MSGLTVRVQTGFSAAVPNGEPLPGVGSVPQPPVRPTPGDLQTARRIGDTLVSLAQTRQPLQAQINDVIKELNGNEGVMTALVSRPDIIALNLDGPLIRAFAPSAQSDAAQRLSQQALRVRGQIRGEGGA